MKLLVFSDSHGELLYMKKAVLEEKPDMVFHLGDVAGDAVRLAREFPGLPVVQVRGNCDGMDTTFPVEREVLLEGKRLWLLHGHSYNVKGSRGPLIAEARARGVDAVFFGHTHASLCDREGSLWVVNPGTAKGWPTATCAVVKLENGELTCGLMSLK